MERGCGRGQRRLGGEDWAFLVLTSFSFIESQMANTTNDFFFFFFLVMELATQSMS